jgi:hypothetical protein
VPDLPSEQPAQGRATVVADGAMTLELLKLRRKAAVLTTLDPPPQACATTVAYELHRHFRLPHWNISVSPHKPENFLVRFDYLEQRDTVIRTGSLTVGTTVFQIHAWKLESYTCPFCKNRDSEN